MSELDYQLEVLSDALTGQDGSAILKATEQLHYADLADFFETIVDEEIQKYLAETLGAVKFAEILPELPEDLIGRSIAFFTKSQQKELLGQLNDDDLTGVMRDLTEIDRATYLGLLEKKDKDLVRSLLKYEEDTAGGWMTTHVGRVYGWMTVKKALEALRVNLESTETLSRIFVVDEMGTILGKLRLRDLAFNTWDTPVRDIMAPIEQTILATADQEEVAMMTRKYDLYVMPVVDENDRLLGAITHDDAMEIAEQESTEDMERLAGLTGDNNETSYLFTTVMTHFKRRFIWLFALALLAVASGYVMLRYEDVLSNVYMLSLFLPMVIAAGGNTGGQAATMVIRSMALGELHTKDFKKVAWKEFRLGSLLGVILATIAAVTCITLLPVFRAPLPPEVSYFAFGSAVSLSLGLQVALSTLIGSLLPLGAKSLKLDPAVIASPAITTIVDVIGMAIYFTTAQAILGL